MANTPQPVLEFSDSCADCGERTVDLPRRLPQIGDDFDWLIRDYDGFRLFMLEELAGRFPERTRWTPADIEVILVEALAVVLDQMSDTLDRVQAEAYLDSARRPESVQRLLKLIGYDAVRQNYTLSWADSELVLYILNGLGHDTTTLTFTPDLSQPTNIIKLLQWLGKPTNALGVNPNLKNRATERALLQLLGSDAESLREALDLDKNTDRVFATQALFKQWRNNPHLMDAARTAGPASVHVNHRMVTLADYKERLEDHPLVLRAAANSRWTGSWSTLEVVLVLAENGTLDQAIDAVISGDEFNALQYAVDDFHWDRELAVVDWQLHPTFRSVLSDYVEHYRLAGQEVWLRDAVPVGLNIGLSLEISDNYFQSEIQQAVATALGTDPGGFFEPGRLAFGEDLYASDLIEVLMALDGVNAVCLNRFKRVGDRYPDQSGSGVIQLSGIEIARCDNRVNRPALGYWTLHLHGGQRG